MCGKGPKMCQMCQICPKARIIKGLVADTCFAIRQKSVNVSVTLCFNCQNHVTEETEPGQPAARSRSTGVARPPHWPSSAGLGCPARGAARPRRRAGFRARCCLSVAWLGDLGLGTAGLPRFPGQRHIPAENKPLVGGRPAKGVVGRGLPAVRRGLPLRAKFPKFSVFGRPGFPGLAPPARPGGGALCVRADHCRGIAATWN